jgi:hypothetical protein
MGILPNSLPKQTNLLFIYENQTMNVRLLAPVDNLEEEQRVTVKFYSFLLMIRILSLLDFTFELPLFNTKTTFIFINSL